MSGVHLFQAVSWLALLIMIPVSGCASSSDEILAFHAGDAPREILSRHTRIPADGQAASFATGKTLVLLDKPELARLHLEAASRRNDAWTDEALWLLHELARRQNRWGTAAGHLRTIIQRSSGSSWYPRALSAHGTLQVQRKIPTEMLSSSRHPHILRFPTHSVANSCSTPPGQAALAWPGISSNKAFRWNCMTRPARP